jgi:phage terminase large subunit-like protein
LGKSISSSGGPQIAATESGNVYVVWAETNNTSGDNDIIFRASANYGDNFGNSRKLGRDTDVSSFSPKMAATESGNVYVVWAETNNTSGESRIVFRGSANHGDNFGRKVLYTYSDPNLDPSPQISATESGNVYVVWDDKDNVYFRSVKQNGSEFGGTIILGKSISSSGGPQIAATESGNVYVVWAETNNTSGDNDIIFRASANHGDNFGNSRKLSRDTDVSSFSPKMAATESGNVYVVWAETNNTSGESRIVFRGSANHGDNFGRKVLYTYSDPNLDPSPQIAATESGNVYVVWRSDGLHFMEIGDRGKLFAGRIVLSDYVSEFHDPLVTETKSGVFYLLWIDKVPTSDLVKLSLKRVSEFYIPRSLD